MSPTQTLLPCYISQTKNFGVLIRIPFPVLGWACFVVALFSFLFCVVWSIIFNFDEANMTHCAVRNYLPSISAAIGGFYPQKYVWMFAVAIDFIPRIMIILAYSKYFVKVLDSRYSKLYNFTVFSYVCENCFLVGLTFITSSSNYTVHAFCFISFLLSSVVYMGSTCYLLKFKRMVPPSNLEAKTLRWKSQFFMIYLFCFIMAGYCFYRHNKYCEPGVYSIFAFFEYCVVLSNMIFHMFAIWDFYDKLLILSSDGLNVS